MKTHKLFSISDFADFARTTRAALILYDKIGLLHPATRGTNGYRYYSVDQLAIVNLIHTWQTLGTPLSEMQKLLENRTPASAREMMEQQIGLIDERIGEWGRARKLLTCLKSTISDVLDKDTEQITVTSLPAEAIVLGGLNDYSNKQNDYDALRKFYRACADKYPDMDLNYPVWALYSRERIQRGDWVWPDRYYFHNSEGFDWRPASLFAIGYKKGNYGANDELYKRLMAYIEESGYEVCGPAYEEYPLNEISVRNPDNYLMRVMITVREKK